jgi:putative heme-binding domain-containing protein
MAPELARREPGLTEDLLLTLHALGVQAGECGSLSFASSSAKSPAELRSSVLARFAKASPKLGRLSFNSARTGCSKCHSIRPGQVAFGPSLADVGTASQPEYLVESILEPSKVIKTGFQSETLETHDGTVVSGLVDAIGDKLLVKVSAEEQVTLALPQVKSRATSQISPMPEGLVAAMSEAELADVVAYLLTLKASR